MAWWDLNCFLHTQRKPEGGKKSLTQRTQSISKNLSHPEKYNRYIHYQLKIFIREKRAILAAQCYRIVLSKVSSFLKVWLKEVNSTGRLYWIPTKEKLVRLESSCLPPDTLEKRSKSNFCKITTSRHFRWWKFMCYVIALRLDGSKEDPLRSARKS